MTIQEAIMSGKPFYRPVWAQKYEDGYQPMYDAVGEDKGAELYDFTAADALADDWEIKQ